MDDANGRPLAKIARISAEQAGTKDHCAAQLARCDKLIAQEFPDSPCVAEFSEVVSISRKARKRRKDKPTKTWLAILELIEAGKVEVLVCTEAPSRICRDKRLAEDLNDLATDEDNPRPVVIRDEQDNRYDLSNWRGRKRWSQDVAEAAAEPEQISVRQLGDRRAMAEAGVWHGIRIPPFGYRQVRAHTDADGRYHHSELVVIPELQAVAAEILQRIVVKDEQGRLMHSLGSTGRWLEAKGYEKWSHHRLRTWAMSPTIAGFAVHRGEIVGKGTWEPLVEHELWNEARKILANPARRTQRGSARVHLHTGRYDKDDPQNAHLCGRCLSNGDLVLMGVCKGRDRKSPAYRCPTCGVVRQRGYVDGLVWDDFYWRLSPQFQEALAAADAATVATDGQGQPAAPDKGPLQRRLNEILGWLTEQYKNPNVDRDDPEIKGQAEAARQLRREIDEIDRQQRVRVEQVERSHNPLLAKARELVGDRMVLDGWVNSLDPEQQRELLIANGLARLVTNPTSKRGPYGYDDPDTIERFWRLPNGELYRMVGRSRGTREGPQEAKPAKSQQPCLCGCGLLGPGRWQPGHNNRPAGRAAWFAKHEGKHLCECGCGQPIPLRGWHFKQGIPRFRVGHMLKPPAPVRLAWLAEQPTHVLCQCGCGQPIPIREWHFKRGIPRFLRGHHSGIQVKVPKI
jgi:hypothetical protein